MNKTKKRAVTLLALLCAFILSLSLGVFCACNSGGTADGADSGAWYYGASAPKEDLGREGDYYLNTSSLVSYVKEGAEWREVSMEEAVAWYYGTAEPNANIGNPNEFYLNTTTGELYQKKSEGGWGSPILTLKGTPGRDGVMWFSGNKEDPNEYVKDDLAVKDARKGDFYLDYSTFSVWQFIEKDGVLTWTKLGSIKGPKGDDAVDPVQFFNGKGAPDAAENAEKLAAAKEGDLYLGVFDGADGKGAGSRLYRKVGGNWVVLMETIKENQLDIHSYADLVRFRESVETNDYANKEVHLKADIDFNEAEGASLRRAAARTVTDWTPIGTSDRPFRGTFDGEGHKIENFTVTASETGARVGFFGYVENATIEHLRFVNANVTATEEATGAAGGVLAGEAGGNTTLTGVTVENSAVATENAAGGLVGKTAEKGNLTVKDSSSEIVVEGGDKVSTEWSKDNVGSKPDSTVFEIPSEEGLMAFAEKVNAGDAFEGVTVILKKDMDLTGKTWVPIGTEKTPFAGDFNGDNKKIENLSFTNTGVTDSPALKYGGFFGVLCGTDDAEKPQKISNLTLSVSINDQANDSRMGGLSGKAYGNILVDHVTVNGAVSSNKIASGFFGDVRYDSGKDQTRTGITCVTIKNSNNYANIFAPKGVGFAANVNGVSFTLEKCENHGDITLPEGATNDVVMGGFTGYIQGNNEVLTFTDCTNFGNITIDITAHINKFSVGGISGGGRSEHNYTNVVNNGNITVDDRETVESVQTGNIIGEIGGLIGSASGAKHLKHVENNGNISVTTINQRNYGVGGVFGQGDFTTLEIGANDEGKHSIVKCTIEVTSTTEVPAENYRVAGAVTGYKANAATKIENTDITVTISPLSASNLGLSGSGSDFTHTEKLYDNIKSVTYHVTAPDSEGIYNWDAAGNLTQTYAIVGVYDDTQLLEAITKINNGEINGIKLGNDVSYAGKNKSSSKKVLKITRSCEIDLNGKTLSITSTEGYDFIELYGGDPSNLDVTIKSSVKGGTIQQDKIRAASSYGVVKTYYTNLTMEGVTINYTGEEVWPSDPQSTQKVFALSFAEKSKITIDNCTINGNIYSGSGPNLTVTNSTIDGSWDLTNTGTATLTGCTLSGATTDRFETKRVVSIINSTVKVNMYLGGSSSAKFDITGGTVEGDVTFSNNSQGPDSFNATGTTFNGDRYIGAGEGRVRVIVLTDCTFEGALSVDVNVNTRNNATLSGCTINGKLTAKAQSRVKLTNGTSYKSSEGEFTEIK